MRRLTITVLLIWLPLPIYSQTFLKAYEKYRFQMADKLPNPQARKKMTRYIKSEIAELDTIFLSYKTKTGFDFNTADSLFLIYDAPEASPFTSAVITWSGRDAICYRQGFEARGTARYKRVITYQPFAPPAGAPAGFRTVTERDSLITLVAQRNFASINHLGDGQSINDGSVVRIYVAYKRQGRYMLEHCFPPAFIIPTSYRK